jgi:drug/metabolite transporter (DMT)-like permease
MLGLRLPSVYLKQTVDTSKEPIRRPVTITIGVLAVVLMASLAHASWNALAKYIDDASLAFAWINLTVAVVGVAFLAVVGLPNSAALPFLLVSFAIHIAYNVFLLNSYRFGDLSQVYPLARGLAPILVTLGAFLFAGEHLNAGEIVGIIIIAGALASIAQFRASKALWLSIATGVAIGAYSLIDGLGVRHSYSPFAYAGLLFLLEGGTLGLGISWTRLRQQRPIITTKLPLGIIAGLLSYLAYAAVLWAQQRAPLGVVSALRETSVIFAALMGGYLLKEGLGRRRVVAALVVCIGVAILVLT